jgi:hypothetical protein
MKQVRLPTIENLLQAITATSRDHLHRRESHAENYNIFRILGVEEKEVSVHSAFIADLLNPFGTHGQRDIVSRLFPRGNWNDKPCG